MKNVWSSLQSAGQAELFCNISCISGEKSEETVRPERTVHLCSMVITQAAEVEL